MPRSPDTGIFVVPLPPLAWLEGVPNSYSQKNSGQVPAGASAPEQHPDVGVAGCSSTSGRKLSQTHPQPPLQAVLPVSSKAVLPATPAGGAPSQLAGGAPSQLSAAAKPGSAVLPDLKEAAKIASPQTQTSSCSCCVDTKSEARSSGLLRRGRSYGRRLRPLHKQWLPCPSVSLALGP